MGALQLPTRDEILGPNRAKDSTKPRPGKDYVFRNVASAFPDTGKNMLLKDRALPKASVKGAQDHSPWRLRVYGNPEHNVANQLRFNNSNKASYLTPLNQREALLLSQSPKKSVADPFYQAETFGKDDVFEPNNSLKDPFDLTQVEERWLGLLGDQGTITEGVQWDEDWYKIQVSAQYRRLVLDLRFQQYLGDIDLKLFDSNGNLVAISQGNGDDEFVNLILDRGGIYFVQIYGSNRGNRYDFKYSTGFTGGSDDEYEENDTLRTAFDLRSVEGKWLSEFRGEGVAADDDFYMIQIHPGQLRLLLDLRYDVSQGDVDVRLLNSKGGLIASSAHIGDDDFVDFKVPGAGVYYIKVYPFSPQSIFNMYDLKWSTQKLTSPIEAANSSSKSKKVHREAAQ